MPKIIIACLIAFTITSCKSTPGNLSGSYENIENRKVIIVKKVTELKYELTSLYDHKKIIFERMDNTLHSEFEDQQYTCDFNITYDTIAVWVNGRPRSIYIKLQD